MSLAANKLFGNTSKRSTLLFLAFIVSLSIILSLAIYLREGSIKDQIDFIDVLLWQMIIWGPWAIAFYPLSIVKANLKHV